MEGRKLDFWYFESLFSTPPEEEIMYSQIENCNKYYDYSYSQDGEEIKENNDIISIYQYNQNILDYTDEDEYIYNQLNL